ncbi:MAG: hypothetical protein AAGL24_29250, partial [Pseudomonadota bacterium]
LRHSHIFCCQQELVLTPFVVGSELEGILMFDLTLGRFGDRRLEKGGRFCTNVLLRLAAVVFGSAGLAAVARARSGLRVFCATTR